MTGRAPRGGSPRARPVVDAAAGAAAGAGAGLAVGAEAVALIPGL